MKSYTTVAAILTIVSLAIGGAEARYGRINSYLFEKVTSDNVNANIEAAFKWLKEQESVNQSILSRTPIRDLKKFTALQQVIDDTKCDRAAYEIMRANEAAVGLIWMLDLRLPLRRVDRLILRIFEDHAKKCSQIYPARYLAMRSQMDEATVERAESVGRTIINAAKYKLSIKEGVSYYNPSNLISEYIKYNPKIGDFQEEVFHDALRASAKDDPDVKYASVVLDERTGKGKIHVSKVKELIENYLIKPCQHYVDELGPNLFIPARFDLEFYSDADDDEHRNYYRGWSYYQICKAVVRGKMSVYSDVAKCLVSN